MHGFFRIHFGNLEPEDENILLIPQLMLDWGARDEVPKEQYQIIKQLGRKYRGKQAWPKLARFIPAFFPATPGQQRLDDFIVILEQTLAIVKRLPNEPNLLANSSPAGKFLVREATETEEGWKEGFETLPLEKKAQKPLKAKKSLLAAYKKLPVGVQVLETDIFMMHSPVKEGNSAAFFPFMWLLINPADGMIVGFEMIPPLPAYEAMLDNLANIMLENLFNWAFGQQN